VSHDELKAMLQHLGLKLSHSDINEVIRYVDTDKDNQISVRELDEELRRAHRRKVRSHEDKMAKAARLVHDGKVRVLFTHGQRQTGRWCASKPSR
jgi:Ca2+-binding EF-hand superfamily protein